MTRCAVCGKRIWSDLVSIPNRGDYHFECAKSSGALLFFEQDRDKFKARTEEVLKEFALLNKMRTEGADSKDCLKQLDRFETELKLLKTWEMVLVRLERERQEEMSDKPRKSQ